MLSALVFLIKKEDKNMNKWPTKADKINIVNQITAAAKVYKQKLVGKTFLYYFEGRYIEVIYRTRDFAHLTGIEWAVPATEVYKNAVNNRLRENQLSFSKRHPYSLCLRKLKHISDLEKLVNSSLIMLEDVGTSSIAFKFGVTELNYTLCLDYDLDAHGRPKGNNLIARSLRDEDCFSKSQSAYEVNIIFSKKNDEKLYNVCTYNDGTVSFENLPQEIKDKVDMPCLAE